jgi:hypothetical protein
VLPIARSRGQAKDQGKEILCPIPHSGRKLRWRNGNLKTVNDKDWHPSGSANFETVRDSPIKTEHSILAHILHRDRKWRQNNNNIIVTMCDYTQVSPGEDILPLKLQFSDI